MNKTQKLNELLESTHPILLGECMRCMGPSRYTQQEAEDIIQTVYCRAIEKQHAVLHSENPIGWLVLCCRNMCMNALQKQHRRNRILGAQIEFHEDDLSVEDAIDQWLQHDMAISLLTDLQEQLTPHEQLIFHEHFELNKPINQIAAEQGMTPGSAQSAIRRIRRKAFLLQCLVFLTCHLASISTILKQLW